ncbi:LOW QUALITY PROTEIN: hypothetical protein Cgig2_018402 [Carnegiea gigantea]|uniref:F-box/LRR-repeat protein 15/At3g58940/PEG3-like LRR domain-containing protein n=1 Tax=Carnegiea gigantea TaxID=171969 RepID=A0A9Q1GMQ3_9CARY|nr:LOW QUALITY PROTEIN: hypothetical protein Cgig2_018402 [Carnegiea gigantea]
MQMTRGTADSTWIPGVITDPIPVRSIRSFHLRLGIGHIDSESSQIRMPIRGLGFANLSLAFWVDRSGLDQQPPSRCRGAHSTLLTSQRCTQDKHIINPRYKWAGLPHVILDEHFYKVVLKSRTFYNKPSCLAVSEYINMINAILLRHHGPIDKFVLHIPEWFSRNPDISQWIYFVSGKFVQEFTLCNGDMKYRKLPSWMFSSVGFNHLTHLTLIDWILPFLSSVYRGFPYFISLKFHLHMVNTTTREANKIGILVSKCPMLESLDLRINEEESCLTIHAPKLQNLVVSGRLSGLCLEEIERIKALTLQSQLDPKSDLMTEFLSHSPHVEKLVLGPDFLRCCTGKVGLPLEQPNLSRELRELKSLILDGTLLQVPSDITFEEDCHFKYLQSAKINGGLGTDSSARIVLQLIKMILLSSPVLEVMIIEAPIPAAEKLNIAMELLRYRRTSTNAEIILKN